jgi:hypothetical protein
MSNIFPLGGDTVLLCGTTLTPDFPVTPDAYDTTHGNLLSDKGFFTMLELPQTLVRSTLLGANASALCGDFALDERGAILTTGFGHQHGFPMTPDAYDTTFHTMFLARISHDLRHLEYGTYIGGSGGEDEYGILTEPGHRVWLAGTTSSEDLPTTPNALIPTFYQPGQENWYGFILCLALSDSGDAAVHSSIPVPSSFKLSAYPNPFNPTTTLTFALPSPSLVTLEVFDVLGRSVYQKDLGRMNAGEHRIQFDGEDLSSGTYFAHLSTPAQSKVAKLVLLR